jgi:tetratricopeptide (TPR) repeat protein
VLAGRYNLDDAALRTEGIKLLRQFFQQSQADSFDEAALRKLAKQIEEIDRKTGGLLPKQHFTAETLMEQALAGHWLKQYQTAVFEGKSEEELAALEKEVRAQLPVGVDFDQFKRQVAHRKVVSDYLQTAIEGDADQAKKLAPTVLDELKDEPDLLNQLAWMILTNKSIKYRDLKFALEVAKEALDVSQEQDANIVDTYARALWDNGQRQEAITWQQKAVQLAPNDAVRKGFQKTLEQYQHPKEQ